MGDPPDDVFGGIITVRNRRTSIRLDAGNVSKVPKPYAAPPYLQVIPESRVPGWSSISRLRDVRKRRGSPWATIRWRLRNCVQIHTTRCTRAAIGAVDLLSG